MSNIHNEEIKEKILEEMDSMTISDFQNLLEDHNLNALNDKLDSLDWLPEALTTIINQSLIDLENDTTKNN